MSFRDGYSKLSDVDRTNIANKALTQFNDNEIRLLQAFGSIMAGQVVHELIYETIKSANINHNIAKEKIFYDYLVAKCEHRFTGQTSIFLDDNIFLKLQLYLVNNNYQLDLELPQDKKAAVSREIERLFVTCITYFNAFVGNADNVVFMNNVKEYLGTDTLKLNIDANTRSLFIDRNCSKCINVVGYYTDKFNKVYYDNVVGSVKDMVEAIQNEKAREQVKE